jgi:hypothetical protein
MRKIYYPNCSELVADFSITDAKEFYEVFKNLTRKNKWQVIPELSIKNLEDLKKTEKSILVLDLEGRTIQLNYGNNGYADLGFWLATSGNNHCDKDQFPFFKACLDNVEMLTFDGGNDEVFNEWLDKHDND